MRKAGWQITLQWVRAYAGTRGNELADAIAKKATTNGTVPESYTRIPRGVVLRQLEEESLQMWQRSWTQTTKGRTTKENLPDIEGRIKMKLNHTGNITTILTGHWNIKTYLKRFQISDDSTCPRGTDNRSHNL